MSLKALLAKFFGKNKKNVETVPEDEPPASMTRRFSMASGRVIIDHADDPAGHSVPVPHEVGDGLDAPLPAPTIEDDPLLADFNPADLADLPAGQAASPSSDTVRQLPGTAPGGVSPPPEPVAAPSPSHKVRVSAKNKTLGALLLATGAINDGQLDEALDRQEAEGGLLGLLLRQMGCIDEEQLAGALAKQRTITTVHLAKMPVSKELKEVFPRSFCLKHRVLPFEKLAGSMMCVAMTNVLDTAAKNVVRERGGAMVKPFDAEWNDLQGAIDRWHDSDAIDIDIELPGEMDERQRRRIASIKKTAGTPGAAAAATSASAAVSTSTPIPAAAKKVMAPAPAPASTASAVATAPRAKAPAGPALNLQALPDEEMPAIPLTASYTAEVVQWNRADPEQRWLATHLVDNVLPLLPAVDVPYSDLG